MYEIMESSVLIKAKNKSYEDKVGIDLSSHWSIKYPFRKLKIGESFLVPFDGTEEHKLRVLCSINGKQYDKKFSLKKWQDKNVYEIGRIG